MPDTVACRVPICLVTGTTRPRKAGNKPVPAPLDVDDLPLDHREEHDLPLDHREEHDLPLDHREEHDLPLDYREEHDLPLDHRDGGARASQYINTESYEVPLSRARLSSSAKVFQDCSGN